MAEDAKIQAYKQAVFHAEGVFDTEVAKNACPSTDVKWYYTRTVIGKGATAKVYKVEEEGKIFAMKQQTKAHYRATGRQANAIREKKYLWAMCNPFIVELFFKSKDKENLYLFLEYTPHGDMSKIIKRGTLPENRARQLLCQVVMALEYVHACNIIFRDLKPENILVFPRGRLKLTDFGLALRHTDDLNVFSGTPPYMSPEMINKALYNHTTDWWSFGITMFELLLARHPFGSFVEPNEAVFKHILSRPIRGLDSANLSADAKDLIRKLLNKDHMRRISNAVAGVDEVKSHPWFKSVDFDRLIIQEDFYELDYRDDYTRMEAKVKCDLFDEIGEDADDPLRADFGEF